MSDIKEALFSEVRRKSSAPFYRAYARAKQAGHTEFTWDTTTYNIKMFETGLKSRCSSLLRGIGEIAHKAKKAPAEHREHLIGQAAELAALVRLQVLAGTASRQGFETHVQGLLTILQTALGEASET